MIAVLLTCLTAPELMADRSENGFRLKPEFTAPYARQDSIDVNLGNAPETFVRAAFRQINGREPDPAIVGLWADQLRQSTRLRRIDVVRALCLAADRQNVPLTYSDPWERQIELTTGRNPRKKTKRDVGAVMMYFFNCPGTVNGAMDWANTHAPGMDQPSPILGFGADMAGYYDPTTNPGFWVRELTDAKYAGLDFVLLNTYGPDLTEKRFATLLPALEKMHDPIKLALFDDTWAWGEPYFGDFWKKKPDFTQTEDAARTLYEIKWRPFFQTVTAQYRYTFRGRPLIYFYNAGTLGPRNQSAAVLKRMKEMFKTDFGVEPFVAVDIAFFDDPAMDATADSKFKWFTFGFPDKLSRSEMNGVVLDHAMVKWDPYGRDRPGATPGDSDLVVKGPEILQQVLNESQDADLLVLATWNDLGEGTGINRNYDYYYQGRWLEPDYFMRMIRRAQLDAS